MFDQYIQALSSWIAYAGALVVLVGVIITLVKLFLYIFTGFNEERSSSLRHSLMVYLSLGLDFLIAKDIILTLLLENGDYAAVIQLAVIIGIRILLSVFIHLEEKGLHSSKKKVKKKR